MAIKVEKQNGVWHVDFGGGVGQHYRDWGQAIEAAHAVALEQRRGYGTATKTLPPAHGPGRGSRQALAATAVRDGSTI